MVETGSCFMEKTFSGFLSNVPRLLCLSRCWNHMMLNRHKIPGSILLIWISAKSYGGLFWAETDPPSKFCGNRFPSFGVIVLTNQQTEQYWIKQTDVGENITYLVKLENKNNNVAVIVQQQINSRLWVEHRTQSDKKNIDTELKSQINVPLSKLDTTRLTSTLLLFFNLVTFRIFRL